MRPRASRTAAILVVVAAAYAAPVRPQEKPAARPDFSGTWTLDAHLSDNPEQVARAIRIDTGQAADQELSGERIEPGLSGVGRGGGGQGAFGGPGRGRRAGADQDEISSDDRKKLDELTDAVQFASPTLTISQTERDITIVSTRGGTQTLATDGKAQEQQLNAGAVERVASWEGPALVVAHELGRAGTLTHTYLLVPTTKQLLIRVNFERRRGEPGPFDIKLVYNRVAQP